MRHKLKAGVTLPELIGVFALIGVLCASIVPHLLEFHQATKLSKLRFNLERFRLRIDDYRQRTGQPPSDVSELFDEMETVFENPISTAAIGSQNRVKLIQVHPPSIHHVTRFGVGGWLYNPETGGIWADSESFLEE